jgi:hypothetical protein
VDLNFNMNKGLFMKTTLYRALSVATLALIIGCGEDIDISSPDYAPVAKDDQASVASGDSVTIDILSNDRANDGRTLDPSSVIIGNDVSNGATVIDESSGEVTYTSDGESDEEESFTYTVKDLNGTTSNSATVTITITSDEESDEVEEEEESNSAPTALDDSATTTEGESITIDVLNNDIDNGGGLDEITIIDEPSNGVVIVNSSGTVSYIPNGGFTGVDGFSYTISDEDGLESNDATVTVSVS